MQPRTWDVEGVGGGKGVASGKNLGESVFFLIFVPGGRERKYAEKLREYTHFHCMVDEGKGRPKPSRDKNVGRHRRRKVGHKIIEVKKEENKPPCLPPPV